MVTNTLSQQRTTYIVKKLFDSIKKFSETYFFQMLPFLIDNMFGGGVFQQTPDMPMGPTVFLFSPTCSFICARQTLCRVFSRKTKRSFSFLCIVFCRPLFVFLSLFFWPLYCNLIQPTILISIQTFDYIYYIHWDQFNTS